MNKAAPLSGRCKNENLTWCQCQCDPEGCLSPWSPFGIKHWLKKFPLSKYRNGKVLAWWVPFVISVINSCAEPDPKGVGIGLGEYQNTWEHCWEEQAWVSIVPVLRECWVGNRGIRAQKSGFGGGWHLYLLGTFDRRREVLKLRGGKCEPHFRHWEDHYLQPRLVLVNTLF